MSATGDAMSISEQTKALLGEIGSNAERRKSVRREAHVDLFGEEVVAAADVEREDLIRKTEMEMELAFLDSIPERFSSNSAAVAAYTESYEKAREATSDLTLVGRAGTEMRRSNNIVRTMLAKNVLPHFARQLFDDPEYGEMQAAIVEAREAGRVAGVTPPEATVGKVFAGVGQSVPGIVLGGLAGAAIAGPGGGFAGAVKGAAVGGGVAAVTIYPYAAGMAEVEYQADLRIRNLRRIEEWAAAGGEGVPELERYDPETAAAYRRASGLMEASVEGASAIITLGAGRGLSRLVTGAAVRGGAAAGTEAIEQATRQVAARAGQRYVGNRGLARLAGQAAAGSGPGQVLRLSADGSRRAVAAIDNWSLTTLTGRTTRAATLLGAGATAEGLEEVTADVLGAKIGRATGAIPDAESTDESRKESFVVGAGAGLILTGLAGGVSVSARAGAALVEETRARSEARAAAENYAAARSIRADRHAAERYGARLVPMTPDQRRRSAERWERQRDMEGRRMAARFTEAAAAAEEAGKARGTPREAEARRAADDAAQAANASVARIETIDLMLETASAIVGEPVTTSDSPKWTVQQAIEAAAKDDAGTGIRPTKRRGNRVERAVKDDMTALGYEVVFYEGNANAAPAFYRAETPGRVYVRIRSEGEPITSSIGRSRRSLMAFALHEVVHDLQWHDPDLYAEIRGVLGDQAIVRRGLSYLRRNGRAEPVGPYSHDMAAAAVLAGPVAREVVAAERGDATTDAVIAQGTSFVETEGSATAVQTGAEASGIERLLARVGIGRAETKAYATLLRRLRESASEDRQSAERRPIVDTALIGPESDRVRDARERLARLREPATGEAASGQGSPAAADGGTQQARFLLPSGKVGNTDVLVRESPEARNRFDVRRVSMLERAIFGYYDPASGKNVKPAWQGRGTVDQLKKMLDARGVKAEEVSWRLGSFLAGLDDSEFVTTEDLKAALKASSITLSFGISEQYDDATMTVARAPRDQTSEGASSITRELQQQQANEPFGVSDPVPDDEPRIVRALFEVPIPYEQAAFMSRGVVRRGRPSEEGYTGEDRLLSEASAAGYIPFMDILAEAAQFAEEAEVGETFTIEGYHEYETQIEAREATYDDLDEQQAGDLYDDSYRVSGDHDRDGARVGARINFRTTYTKAEDGTLDSIDVWADPTDPTVHGIMNGTAHLRDILREPSNWITLTDNEMLMGQQDGGLRGQASIFDPGIELDEDEMPRTTRNYENIMENPSQLSLSWEIVDENGETIAEGDVDEDYAYEMPGAFSNMYSEISDAGAPTEGEWTLKVTGTVQANSEIRVEERTFDNASDEQNGIASHEDYDTDESNYSEIELEYEYTIDSDGNYNYEMGNATATDSDAYGGDTTADEFDTVLQDVSSWSRIQNWTFELAGQDSDHLWNRSEHEIDYPEGYDADEGRVYYYRGAVGSPPPDALRVPISVTTSKWHEYRSDTTKKNPDFVTLTLRYDAGPTTTKYKEPHGLGPRAISHVRGTWEGMDLLFVDEMQSVARKHTWENGGAARPDVLSVSPIPIEELQRSVQGPSRIHLPADIALGFKDKSLHPFLPDVLTNPGGRNVIDHGFNSLVGEPVNDAATILAINLKDKATYSEAMSEHFGYPVVYAEGIDSIEIPSADMPTVKLRAVYQVGVYARAKEVGSDELQNPTGGTLDVWNSGGTFRVLAIHAPTNTVIATAMNDTGQRPHMDGLTPYTPYEVAYAVTRLAKNYTEMVQAMENGTVAGKPTLAMPLTSKPVGGDPAAASMIHADSWVQGTVKAIIDYAVRVASASNGNDFKTRPVVIRFPNVKQGTASHMKEKGSRAVYGPKGTVPKFTKKLMRSIGMEDLLTEAKTDDENMEIRVDQRLADLSQQGLFTQFARPSTGSSVFKQPSVRIRRLGTQFAAGGYGDKMHAFHSLSWRDLLRLTETNGVPMPSIEALPANRGEDSIPRWADHNGKVTLAMSGEAAEEYLPGFTYGRDLYSPRLPEIRPRRSRALKAAATARSRAALAPQNAQGLFRDMPELGNFLYANEPGIVSAMNAILFAATKKGRMLIGQFVDPISSQRTNNMAMALVLMNRSILAMKEPRSSLRSQMDLTPGMIPDSILDVWTDPEMQADFRTLERLIGDETATMLDAAQRLHKPMHRIAEKIQPIIEEVTEIATRIRKYSVVTQNGDLYPMTDTGLRAYIEQDFDGEIRATEYGGATFHRMLSTITPHLMTMDEIRAYVSNEVGQWTPEERTHYDKADRLYNLLMHDRAARYEYPTTLDPSQDPVPYDTDPQTILAGSPTTSMENYRHAMYAAAVRAALDNKRDVEIEDLYDPGDIADARKAYEAFQDPSRPMAGDPDRLARMEQTAYDLTRMLRESLQFRARYAEAKPIRMVPFGSRGFAQAHIRVMDIDHSSNGGKWTSQIHLLTELAHRGVEVLIHGETQSRIGAQKKQAILTALGEFTLDEYAGDRMGGGGRVLSREARRRIRFTDLDSSFQRRVAETATQFAREKPESVPKTGAGWPTAPVNLTLQMLKETRNPFLDDRTGYRNPVMMQSSIRTREQQIRELRAELIAELADVQGQTGLLQVRPREFFDTETGEYFYDADRFGRRDINGKYAEWDQDTAEAARLIDEYEDAGQDERLDLEYEREGYEAAIAAFGRGDDQFSEEEIAESREAVAEINARLTELADEARGMSDPYEQAMDLTQPVADMLNNAERLRSELPGANWRVADGETLFAREGRGARRRNIERILGLSQDRGERQEGTRLRRQFRRDVTTANRADRAARRETKQEVTGRYAAALRAVREEDRGRRGILNKRVQDIQQAIATGAPEPIVEAREALMDELRALRMKDLRDSVARETAAREFREVAVALTEMLPRQYQGALARRIADATTFERAMRLAVVIDGRMAQAEYDAAVTQFRKTEKRLRKFKLGRDAKEAIGVIMEAGRRGGFTPEGHKIRAGSPSQRQAAAAALHDAATRALDAAENARNDWRQSREDHALELRKIGTDIARRIARRPKRRRAPGSSEAPGVDRLTDPAQFASADVDLVSAAIDGERGGPLMGLFNAMRQAETKKYGHVRDMMGVLDGLAQAAGFRDLDNLRDRAGDRRGPGVTEYRTITLGGEKFRVTLGQLLKLLATDYETLTLMADSEAVDEQGIPMRSGVGMKLGDADDGRTITGFTRGEVFDLRQQFPELTALVESMKQYRESNLRNLAFDAHERLKGYSPAMVPGYEPRSRDIKGFILDATMQSNQVSSGFAENAGFTKDRVAGGGPVVVGDFVTDFLRNADASLQLAYMAEPTRDLWSIVMDPKIRELITSRHGKNGMARLIDMMKNSAGLAPRQGESRLAGITSLTTQGVLALNPGTWQKVLLGGINNLTMDMEYAEVLKGIASAGTVSMDEIEYLSGYLWHRNANSANDRRAFTRDDTAQGSRMAGGLVSSGRGFAAAHKNLMLAIKADIEGQPVGRGSSVKAAAHEFARAFDPGMLNTLDRQVIRVAVAGHLSTVKREMPDASPGEQMAEAVARAEMTIRRTQNTSSPIDDSNIVARSTVQQDALTRSVLPFASDPLKSAARLHEGIIAGDKTDSGKWAAAAFVNAGINVMANFTVAALTSALVGDDEPYEDMLAKAQRARTTDGLPGILMNEIIGRTGIVGFAVGGDAAEFLYREATGRRGYEPGLNLLVLDAFQRVVNDAIRFYNSTDSAGGTDWKRGYRTLAGLSQMFGLPGPILRRLEYLLPESFRDALRADSTIRAMGDKPDREQAAILSAARREMRATQN